MTEDDEDPFLEPLLQLQNTVQELRELGMDDDEICNNVRQFAD